MTRRWLAFMGVVAAVSCGGGPPASQAIDMGHDACASCRMVIVAQATAAQIVAPGEEPLFFDEIGCLRDYLRVTTPGTDARVYVADHRTGQWVEAGRAVFTQTPASTPMTSGLLAHADAASRDADPAAAGGNAVATADILSSQGRGATP